MVSQNWDVDGEVFTFPNVQIFICLPSDPELCKRIQMENFPSAPTGSDGVTVFGIWAGRFYNQFRRAPLIAILIF